MMQEKKIRILMVCTVPTEKSGIPNVIFNLINSLNRDAMEFAYIAINNPEDHYKSELKKTSTKLFVINRKITSPLHYIKSLVKISKGYDIIHVHGNSATMVLEMIAARIAKVKLRIAHSHNTTCAMKCIDKIARPIFYRLCNGRLACSDLAGKWLFGERDFTVINNGISLCKYSFNPDTRTRMRKMLSLDGCKVIGHIGNFVKQKNHTFIINTFHIIAKRDATARLLLLGDGLLKSKIENVTKDLGIYDKVIFVGSVEDTAQYMQAMDIAIMPSLFEGLPLTMIEEQANGLNIIASDTISPSANLTKKVVYMPLDAGAERWSDKILQELSTVTRNKEMSDSAIKKIKDAGFEISDVANRLHEFYKNALNK